MHSTADSALGHDYDEPPRSAWTFRKRIVAQAESAEADEPPETVIAGRPSPPSWWNWVRLISGRTPGWPATSRRRAR